MKKSIISLLTVTLTAITLSGCALAPVPDMTEEQEKLVAEYAAGLLLKYDQSYDNQIMTPEQLEKANNELTYFNSLNEQLSIANYFDALDIKEELSNHGYLKKTNNKNKKD